MAGTIDDQARADELLERADDEYQRAHALWREANRTRDPREEEYGAALGPLWDRRCEAARVWRESRGIR